jgi:dolichol-phosphate mannosyltransferase
MWREWGRSFDLKDATPVVRRWFDVLFVWLMQALPIPLLLTLLAMGCATQECGVAAGPLRWLWVINAVAALVRLSMLSALAGSYAERGAPFWLSWTADVAAAVRLTISTARRPRAWRGRDYPVAPAATA